MKQSLAWLALIGAALYAVSTWPFADAVSVSKDQNWISSGGSPASGPSLAPTPQVSDVAAKQESTEKPEAQGTFSVVVQIERLVVRTAANIRSGPSSKSALMGKAHEGAELEVAEREAGWVRFVDPATSHTGWIHEGLLSPLGSESVSSTIERPITASAGDAAEPPNAKLPRNGIRPAASHHDPKQRVGGRTSISGYAQLPTGEEFRPNKRRFGPFARSRMLREGLLSGDLTLP